VSALATIGDSLYAGGAFHAAGSVNAASIARWDGATWSALGQGLTNGDDFGSASVLSLASFKGRLIAGGVFLHADSLFVDNLAAWNGSSWESMGYSTGMWIYALAVVGDSLVAAGSRGTITFHGDTADYSGADLYSRLFCVAPYGGGYVIGGQLVAFDPGTQNARAFGVALNSGGTWHGFEPWTAGMRGLTGVSGVEVQALETYRDSLVAMGIFSFAGDPPGWDPIPTIASWDGAAWHPFPRPDLYGGFPTQLLAWNDTLYVGGSFSVSDDSTAVESPVLRYAGGSWGRLGSLSLYPSALGVYRGEIFVAGQRPAMTGAKTEIYRFHDGLWELVGSAASGFSTYTTIGTMIEYDGKLVIGGSFDGISGVPAVSVASWDGSRWETMNLESQPYYYPHPGITHLIVHNGALVAAGVLPGYASPVLQWERTSWKPVGAIAGYGVHVASAGNEIYLAGLIDIGNGLRAGLARWSGQEWEPLGSGTNDQVNALKPWRESLYVGGRFTMAGGHSSFGMGRWDGLLSVLGAPRVTLAPGTPNPFRATSSFTYRLASAGRVHVSVIDIRGREILVLEDGERSDGNHTIVWNGRGRDGKAAPSGVYFVRVQGPGGAETTRKAVLIR
jgi:hypothetical protein